MEWLRREDETDKSYAAFKTYLEMEDRSLQILSKMLSKSRQHLGEWSRKYNWKERAAAYDSSIVEETRGLRVDKIKDAIERKNKIAQMLETKALEALNKKDPSKVSGRSISEWLTLANTLRNESRELSESAKDDTIKIIIQSD